MTTMTRLRPATRKQLEQIAQAKGWTITEAASRAVDSLIEKEGLTPITSPHDGSGQEGLESGQDAGGEHPQPSGGLAGQ